MDAATEFDLVSRICARARWSTSGEHAKSVRDVIQQVRSAALEDAAKVAEAGGCGCAHAHCDHDEAGHHIAAAIRRLK